MIYLLDVNALLALGYGTHVHHERVQHWLTEQRELHAPSAVKLATCAITELGFIRIASGPPRLASSVAEARAGLRLLKMREHLLFIGDRVTGTESPPWVVKSPDTTDGHLLTLAKANGARLATLDRCIPGAEFIPNAPDVGGAPLNLAMHCRCSL